MSHTLKYKKEKEMILKQYKRCVPQEGDPRRKGYSIYRCRSGGAKFFCSDEAMIQKMQRQIANEKEQTKQQEECAKVKKEEGHTITARLAIKKEKSLSVSISRSSNGKTIEILEDDDFIYVI